MKVEIDQQTEDRLKEIAAVSNLSPEALAAEILLQQTQNKDQVQYWREHAEDNATLKAMKKGDFVEHNDMMNFLDDLASK